MVDVFVLAQFADLYIVDVRDGKVETAIPVYIIAAYRRASCPVDVPTVLELLSHEFLLLIFLLFSHYLCDLILTDIDMGLNPTSEVYPFVEIENDGESEEQSAQCSRSE